MKFPPRIVSIIAVVILGIGGLAALSVWSGAGGRLAHVTWAKPGGDKHHGHHKKGCDRHRREAGTQHGRGPHGPDRLAERLSVMETKIGIRANQLDAWRDFTDTLQATMKRPMTPGAGLTPDEKAEPFSLADQFADISIARAKRAEELKKAIDTLRSTLTPEQLDKVKAIEATFRARLARAHGWHHGPRGSHGKGKHSGPPAAKPAPDAAPSGTPDDAPDGGGESNAL
jgi:hypothetical protein